MENEYSQYSFDEVKSRFADRVICEDAFVQQKKLDIKDREGLIKRIEEVAGNVVVGSDKAEIVDESIPLTLAVVNGGDFLSVQLLIDTDSDYYYPSSFDEDKTLATIVWERMLDGTFKSGHRFVSPEYRRNNGLGTMLLKASEAVVNNFAKKKASIGMVQNVGQLDVMMWLLKNGYRPRTREDGEKLDMVLNGDESLFITERNYIFTVSLPEEQRTNLNEENSKKSFRISFVKDIRPGLSKNVDGIQSDIGQAVGVAL